MITPFFVHSWFIQLYQQNASLVNELIWLCLLQVARCQQVVKELQSEVTKYRESSFSTPEISQMYEQKAIRLEAELQVSDEERRKAGEEIIKLQSQLSESEYSKKGHMEALAQEVRQILRNKSLLILLSYLIPSNGKIVYKALLM